MFGLYWINLEVKIDSCKWMTESAVKTWPRIISWFDMAKTCLIICLTENLILPECVNHNTPLFVSREKKENSIFLLLHDQGNSLTRKPGCSLHTFSCFFFQPVFFSSLVFSCRAGAKATLHPEWWHLTSSVVLNMPAWFWPETKMSIVNNGADWHYVSFGMTHTEEWHHFRDIPGKMHIVS